MKTSFAVLMAFLLIAMFVLPVRADNDISYGSPVWCDGTLYFTVDPQRGTVEHPAARTSAIFAYGPKGELKQIATVENRTSDLTCNTFGPTIATSDAILLFDRTGKRLKIKHALGEITGVRVLNFSAITVTTDHALYVFDGTSFRRISTEGEEVLPGPSWAEGGRIVIYPVQTVDGTFLMAVPPSGGKPKLYLEGGSWDYDHSDNLGEVFSGNDAVFFTGMSTIVKPFAGNILTGVRMPRFRPDGMTIAFIAAKPDTRLRYMAYTIPMLPAAQPKPVAGTDGATDIAWSTDGRLAVTTLLDLKPHLLIADFRKGNPTVTEIAVP